MLVGTLADITFARRFVLFNADSYGSDPISYSNADDIPIDIRNAHVTEIVIPQSSKWYNGNGVIMITYKYGN